MTDQPEIFMLSEFEKAHPLWRRLSEYLEHRLQNLREQNDHMAPEEITLMNRGRIAMTKEIIGLGKVSPFVS